MGSRGPEPSRGAGGGALEKRLFVGGGLGRGCTPRGRMRPRPGSRSQESPPRRPGKTRTPSGASPRRPRAAGRRGSRPSHAHTCASHAELENFALGPRAPLTPSVAAFGDSPSPRPLPWRGKKSRVTAASGADNPARTAPEGSGGGSHRTPAGAPRDRPGQGWAPESSPRQSAAPRFRGSWGIPSPRRESGD